MRKCFTKLPNDIQELITNMLSTIPENRDPESLQRAIELFDTHINRKQLRAFTEKPVRDKKRSSDRRKGDIKKTRILKPREPKVEVAPLSAIVAADDNVRSGSRIHVLFALLCLVYAQYLFVFDGQEKINQSMPTFYSAVVDELQGLIGKTDVRGNFQSENSRVY